MPKKWVNMNVTPPAVNTKTFGMVYDPTRANSVIFGGVSSGAPGTPYFNTINETWTFDSSGPTWTEEAPATVPDHRFRLSLSFDVAQDYTLMFGGAWLEDQGGIGYRNHYDDTWTWDGTDWTDEAPATTPEKRGTYGLAFDEARGETVMFGGQGGDQFHIGLTELDDTWTWDGTDWTQLSPANSPAARYGHIMVYDATREVIVLYGGQGAGTTTFDDTWEWDGTDWTEVFPSTVPDARAEASAVWDSVRQTVVMFNGYTISPTVYLDETWEYDGTDWQQISLCGSPGNQQQNGLSFDSVFGLTILYGGWTVGGGNDPKDVTWEYPESCFLPQIYRRV